LKKSALLLIPLLLLPLLSVFPLIPEVHAQVTGPYVDELIYSATTDESKALGDISAGLTDMYLWRVPIPLLDKARGDPNVRLITSLGGYLSLVFNPCNQTTDFNAFKLKAVRQAMQYLIDRSYIINVIHKGDAAPRILFYGRYDADYAYVADLGESLLAKYVYNFDRANQLVTTALTGAGASKGTDGKWRIGGNLITINGLIRVDDPVRRSIGDIFATDLERLGFTVNRNYGDLNKAYDVVYGSDPVDALWHFYTEGWRSSALTKFDTAGLPQMYSPFLGYMPGWQEPGYWQYLNETLDTEGEKYYGGDFTSVEDRAAIMRRVLEMGFEESVRIFLVDQLYAYPSNAKFPPFAYELAVGPQTPYSFYTIRLPEGHPDRRSDGTGGSLKIAQKLMYQGAYNPIAGFTDVYSVNIWNVVSDPGLWPDPHTGIYLPVRAPFTVKTSGPTGTFSVPADAETWDYVNHKWKTVGSGVTAVSNVTFDLKLSKWHYGEMMNTADIRYALYMSLEWSTRGVEGANDPRYDSYYASLQTAWVDNFVGIKFIDQDTVQVYTDYWFPDDPQIAAFSSVWPQLPWEVLYLTETVVMGKAAGYSRAASTAIGKPWLDLVAPNAGLPELKANLTAWAGTTLPIAGNSTTGTPLPYFDAGNRTLRYDTLNNWVNIAGHNHLLVSNGPFYFDKTDRPIAQNDIVKAYRDATYPFKPGDWNYLVPVGTPAITTEAPSSVVIGKDAVINVKVTISGVPSSAASVIYLIFDSAANVILSGTADVTSIIGTFEVLLNSTQTAEFNPGGYTLSIIAYSSSVITPQFDSKVFTALPPFEEIIGADLARLRTDVGAVSDDVAALTTTTDDIQSRVGTLEGTIALLTNVLYVAIVLIVVVIAISVLMFLRYIRKIK